MAVTVGLLGGLGYVGIDAVLIWEAFCQGGKVKRRAVTVVACPPRRCGQVSSPVGVERVDADALSSLTCAGWLPQDRGFEVGVGPLV